MPQFGDKYFMNPQVGRASQDTAGPLEISGPPSDVASQPKSRWPAGMTEAPNINLYNRPTVHNPDGTISSVRSMSFNMDGKEILVPTVSDDGRILADREAMDTYRKTGKHLGIFTTPQAADAYAEQLHNDYAAGKYGSQRSGDPAVQQIQTTPWNPSVVSK